MTEWGREDGRKLAVKSAPMRRSDGMGVLGHEPGAASPHSPSNSRAAPGTKSYGKAIERDANRRSQSTAKVSASAATLSTSLLAWCTSRAATW